MPTRSYIGRLLSDGSVQAVYCHWDGIPSMVGETLFDNYGLHNISKLLEKGRIRCLKPLPNDIEVLEDQQEKEILSFKNIRDFSDHGQDFNYLLLTTDRWVVHNRREYPNWIDLQLAISDYVNEDDQ